MRPLTLPRPPHATRLAWALAATLLLLTAGCPSLPPLPVPRKTEADSGGGDSGSGDSGTGGDSDTTDGGDLAAGEAVYTGTCAACHGATGDLGVEIGGKAAADLNVKVPAKTDPEITVIVQDGYRNMPAQAVDDEEMVDLLVYLRATFG